MAPESGDAVNMGAVQRKLRLMAGIVTLVTAIVMAAYLVMVDAGRAWRLLFFIPFWAGTQSVFEARSGVCPRMAQRGEWNLEAAFSFRGEKLEDAALAEALQERAAETVVRSLLIAAVLTGLYVLLVP